MDLQIIKINGFHKIILIKTSFRMTLKVRNGGVEPDGLPQVELGADFIQGMKNLVGAGICSGIADHSILQHAVVFKDLGP